MGALKYRGVVKIDDKFKEYIGGGVDTIYSRSFLGNGLNQVRD